MLVEEVSAGHLLQLREPRDREDCRLLSVAALRRGDTNLSYKAVDEQLRPLLVNFAPPVKGSVEAALPFWHLQSDGVWEIEGADALERNKKGFPLRSALKQSVGRLTNDVVSILNDSPALQDRLILYLLKAHFPESLHAELMTAIGLENFAYAVRNF